MVKSEVECRSDVAVCLNSISVVDSNSKESLKSCRICRIICCFSHISSSLKILHVNTVNPLEVNLVQT